MNKISFSILIKVIASPALMALMLIILAISAALATFIENDFGSQAAKALIYNAHWFEFIFFVLTVNLLATIFYHKLYRKEKLSILMFHAGFIVIVVGAAVTRYFGQEGSMHIREGEEKMEFLSSENWLLVYANNNQVSEHIANFTSVSRNNFKSKISYNGFFTHYELIRYIPNAVEKVVEQHDGVPIVSLIAIDSTGNIPIHIEPAKPVTIGGMRIGFSGLKNLHIEVFPSDSGILARSAFPVTAASMMSRETKSIEASKWIKLSSQVIYSTSNFQFTLGGFTQNGRVIMAYSPDPLENGVDALEMKVKTAKDEKNIFIPLSKYRNEISEVVLDGVKLGFSYGPRRVQLPFSIKLNDFILDRYPGSSSPSSFISNVVVNDSEKGVNLPFSIFMNNILNYRGYRFYQSSYDIDEKGTYLSVNNDFTGTAITYFGYFILILGMLWNLVSPGSRFRKLIGRTAPILIVLILLFSGQQVSAKQNTVKVIAPNERHSAQFGKLLVQDKGGRIKPLSTLAGEALRKINRHNSLQGFSAEQVFLGMISFPENWQHISLIKVTNGELRSILGIRNEYAAFVDFFNHESGGSYKLSQLVQQAFAVKPAKRTPLQKEIIKVDERVNILYMIFSGQLARFIPIPGHSENRWLSMSEATHYKDSLLVSPAANLFTQYIAEVRTSSRTGDWKESQQLLDKLIHYQSFHGAGILPSAQMVKLEVFSNKLLAFERLIPIYGIIGLLLIILAFIGLLSESKGILIPYYVLSVSLFIAFVIHSTAIGLRWYVAGRAPLSNGYESMIYVAWATMLAGFIFWRRNRVVLPATALLSTLTLFVAHLSWMDPEITNLVPVLKSYWLTIHVAVITASYGFLGLGALLGFLNLSLLAIKSKTNKDSIELQVNEITSINELTLTIGLYLLTAGSFLGAVWANESWGRYWGWDPKETWALITILVYTFILHMRLIPSVRTAFSFNFASLVGISSVLMTYFGVNYYLSGLHSYAGGDPIPVPSWLYFVVGAIFSFSFFAWYNNRLVENETKV